MAQGYLDTLVTPAVAEAQTRYYGHAMVTGGAVSTDPLGEEERGFIASRDSFYMATISENGWPYIQHRGGRRGFLRVVSPTLLAFADYKGNRQLLSTGNLAKADRVSLFLMDYPQRARLKILGHARVEDARAHPELVAEFAEPADRRIVERVFLIDVVSFDWNCPKYITPRFTAEDVAEALAPLRARIVELEAQLNART
jgi:predicted pyridoxine 5'-phosphate oxidase superfamily flavin-nucleotide-binding protein